MIPTIQRMIDVAQLHRRQPHLFGSLPCSRPVEEDPLAPLLLGLGALGQSFRAEPGGAERLAELGADLYLLVVMLMAGRTSPPPSDRDVQELAIEQAERYLENPNGDRWRRQPPLEHLMRAFGHWTAVAPVLSVESGDRPRGMTRMQLADLANYLMFFLSASGALDRLPAPSAAG